MSYGSPQTTPVAKKGFNLYWDEGGGVHVCLTGPVWSAKAIDAGRWDTLVNVGTLAAPRWIAISHSVGAGSTPTAVSTDDGATWATGALIPNGGFGFTPIDAAFGNGHIVSYGAFGESYYSDDLGVTWAFQSPGVAFACNHVRFGNGLFVYVGNGGNTYSSANGKGVTTRATPVIFSDVLWDAVAGYWIGFPSAGNTQCYSSPDLITWTAIGNLTAPAALAIQNSLCSVANSGSVIVVTWTDGTTRTNWSNDHGVTWNASGLLPQTGINSTLYGNGIFLITASIGGIVMVSTDNGQTWGHAGGTHDLTNNGTWTVGYDGLNTWVAIRDNGANDVIANQGLC